jgi:hypothetical protein
VGTEALYDLGAYPVDIPAGTKEQVLAVRRERRAEVGRRRVDIISKIDGVAPAALLVPERDPEVALAAFANTVTLTRAPESLTRILGALRVKLGLDRCGNLAKYVDNKSTY